MTTSFPARHEAIRKVLVDRGYTMEDYTDLVEIWSNRVAGQSHRHGDTVRLPVDCHSEDGYAWVCEEIEIRLGMRLPPEVQRAVDAERARCASILREALEVEVAYQRHCEQEQLPLNAEMHEHAVERLRDVLTKIESE